MSLQAMLAYILEQTAHVAHTAFPKGALSRRMRDVLDPIATNSEFAALFSTTRRPTEAPTYRSQGVLIRELRRSRSIGLIKTGLLHLLIAAVLNFVRVAVWLVNIPHARTRPSAFGAAQPSQNRSPRRSTARRWPFFNTPPAPLRCQKGLC